MNALDLIMLGRQLAKIGEGVLRVADVPARPGRSRTARSQPAQSQPAQSQPALPQPALPQPAQRQSGQSRPAQFMPAGPSLVLQDVFAHPGSPITDITARTGLPQSYVSESVARLRDQGMVETSADPGDGRRTLVRVSAQHSRTVVAKGSVSADAALAAALGEPEGGADVTQIIDVLSAIAARLRPEPPGPIGRQLEQARGEP